ncbi:MAG TPA: acyltransferase [Jatrophihabitans sp.]|nr:acyltransferase [Jatrophihabitans sp.]
MSTATLARPTEHQQAPPTAPEGTPRRTRSRELEGYRGIAALSIVVFHVCQYAFQSSDPAKPSGRFLTQLSQFEIVDILFVLSAYLLTLSYARAALNQGSGLSAGVFLFRRAVRILPLYWVGVTVVWAMRNPTLPGDWRDLLEHLTFTQVFDQKRIFYTLGPTWSMSLEIMFYLALVVLGPLAVRACRGIASRRARVALLLAGTGVLYLIPVVWNSTAYLVFHVSYDHWPVYFGPQARFGAFAVGMALAVLVAARDSEPLFRGAWPTVLRVAGFAIVAGATWYDRPNTWGQVGFHDIAALGWMLLMASTVLGEPDQRWARLLSWRPLVLAGLISYSTYMWHEPIMQTLANHGITSRSGAGLPWAIVAVLTCSVIAGAISYRVIEFPSSKLRRLRNSDGSKRDYYPELSRTGG